MTPITKLSVCLAHNGCIASSKYTQVWVFLWQEQVAYWGIAWSSGWVMRLESSLPEPSAPHTTEPEMKGDNSGQAAYGRPETTQAAQPYGAHFPLGHSRSLCRWDTESSYRDSTAWSAQPSGQKCSRVQGPGGKYPQQNPTFEIPCHSVERTVSSRSLAMPPRWQLQQWPCVAAHPIDIFIGDDSFPTTQPISHGRRGAAGQPQKDFDVNTNSPDREQSVRGKRETKSQ